MIAADNDVLCGIACIEPEYAGRLFNLLFYEPGREEYPLAVNFGTSFFQYCQSRWIAKIHPDLRQNLQSGFMNLLNLFVRQQCEGLLSAYPPFLNAHHGKPRNITEIIIKRLECVLYRIFFENLLILSFNPSI